MLCGLWKAQWKPNTFYLQIWPAGVSRMIYCGYPGTRKLVYMTGITSYFVFWRANYTVENRPFYFLNLSHEWFAQSFDYLTLFADFLSVSVCEKTPYQEWLKGERTPSWLSLSSICWILRFIAVLIDVCWQSPWYYGPKERLPDESCALFRTMLLIFV